MSTTSLAITIIVFLIFIFLLVNLFSLGLNDFIEKTLKKTLWLWLPFHALRRLSKEFAEKYLK